MRRLAVGRGAPRSDTCGMSSPSAHPDATGGASPAADAALRSDPVVWLSTVRPDGRPHLVPVWFHWDGEQIVAFSKPRARKVENLRDRPSVMLAVGTPGPDFDVELIEAVAVLPDSPSASIMPEGFAHKYRELLRRAGLTAQRFAEVYSQAIVLRPTRFLGYGGAGWHGPSVAAT
jgi:PPOX class probable F420-dependent enzyme